MNAKIQVLEAYSLLRMMYEDLSDSMMMEVDEWMEALREEVRMCKDEGVEMDYHPFGEWINQICDDDGMPHLYVAEEEV